MVDTYGNWRDPFEIGGIVYPAEKIEQYYAERAGFDTIYAVNGLPPEFETALVKAAQVCDVPHTWRIQECANENDVPETVIEKGKAVLTRDRDELGAHIISYVGVQKGGDYEFLAAGAIRDKLTRDFHNPLFPVVSRAVVAQGHRGKGLGSLIVEHRFKAVLRFFGQMPKGIHFGTESEKILHSIQKVERDENIKYVLIGYEAYNAEDGAHKVADYFCFLPDYQQEILKACDDLTVLDPNAVSDFKNNILLFMRAGVENITGAQLKESFQKLSELPTADDKTKNAFATIEEFFTVKQKIGAEDLAEGIK